MKTIAKPSDTLGGILKLWAIPQKDMYRSGKNLVISNTSNSYEIYCSPDTISLQQKPKVSSVGTSYNTNVSGFIPKFTEQLEAALSEMENISFNILFQDGNGNYLLAGDTFYPLKLNSEATLGKKTQDRSGCSIHFSGQTILRAQFVNFPF